MSLRHVPATVGWGLFCACSWTWCIGMFLPIILLREFGWPGFLVFAVPNVLGCAAFGYVLRDASRRTALLSRHQPATVLFSATVIGYHLFFAAYLATMVTGGPSATIAAAMALPAAVYLLGYGLSWLPARAWLPVAAVLYAGSMLTFTATGTAPLRDVPWSGVLTRTDLACLAPVFVFGFLLSPYLDLTFHRALESSPSRHCFAVFGVAFIPILLLTIACRGSFTPAIVGYIMAQSVFTVAAHFRELREASWPRGRGPRWALLALPAAAAGLCLLPGDGEDTYLRMLGLYGLFFPAYVLVFMARRGGGAPRMPELLLYGAAMLAFAPMLEVAFIHTMTWPAVIPVAAMILWAGWARARQ